VFAYSKALNLVALSGSYGRFFFEYAKDLYIFVIKIEIFDTDNAFLTNVLEDL
jgi:hypothetical protein